MTSLIQKLRDATSGSRELDMEILSACDVEPTKWPHDPVVGTESIFIIGGKKYSLPPVSRSLDAIIGLIEEKLPGWKWSINQLDYGCNCFVKPPLKTMGDIELQGLGEGGAHSSAPIALCIALLSALEGESDG